MFLDILNHIMRANSKSQFIAEVTNKTRADVKGGTLIDYNGQAKLLEYAQVHSCTLFIICKRGFRAQSYIIRYMFDQIRICFVQTVRAGKLGQSLANQCDQ